MEEETLDQLHARHRKEQRDLQARITSKKKNATKKTRKGINDECAELERQLRERQEEEIKRLGGDADGQLNGPDGKGDVNGLEGSGKLSSTPDAELASTLEATTLTDPAKNQAPSNGTEQISTTTQPAKKRNRQKERLARRAAEQEAVAEAAQAEAASMVDHRKLEKTYMLKEFKANALVEKEIQPDGHCLFSAVADQLEQNAVSLGGGSGAADTAETTEPHKRVRRAAVGYMQAHPDDFMPFMEEPFDTYVSKMRDTAEWGGQLELLALANTYNVEIRVVQEGSTEVVRPTEVKAGAEPKEIWLAYYRHGYGLGEHYNSLRKAQASKD